MFDDIDTPVSIDELSGTDEDPGQISEEKGEVTESAVVAEETQEKEVDKAEVQVEEQKPEREPVIPRARFDELNSKLHAEREETERLRAELGRISQVKAPAAESATIDINDLEQQHFDALMVGDKDAAVAIRAKINAEIYSRAEAASEEKVSRQLSERESKSAFAGAVDKAVAAYPFLDSTSSDSNPQAIADVVEWRDFYITKGDAPAIALQKAAARIGPMYASNTEPTPVAAEDNRKQQALARNAKDALAQAPAPVAGIGNRAGPVALKIESQDDLEKLSKKERDELLMNS